MTVKVNSFMPSTRLIPVQVEPARELVVPVRMLTIEELEERIAPATNLNSSKSNYP
jgi:hypothetical protein